MPDCFSLVLCQTVLLDQRTSNFSLVNLFETIQVPFLGAVWPIEMLSCWLAGPEQSTEKAYRVKFIIESDDQDPVETESPRDLYFRSRYNRVSSIGLQLPPKPGNFRVKIALRENSSSEWKVQPVFWPLTLQTAVFPQPIQQPQH